ncbi:MAG: sodium:proton antiporter [Alphaproteobacteria bacterium]
MIKNFIKPLARIFFIVVAIIFSTPSLALAASEGHLIESGNLLWALPFIGLLLCLALAPIFFHHIWDEHFDKITLFWVLLVFVPLIFLLGFDDTISAVIAMLFYEYLPFIILLATLFVISGGITIHGYFDGRPDKNLQLLLVGTLLASLMGTMGAAMLLIRPLLVAARRRQHQSHLVVFFIILVANIGGALSPLGDPPLFLGFLRGVDFFWPLQNLWAPFLLTASIVLVIFYVVDVYLWRREKQYDFKPAKLKIRGTHNFLFLFGVVLTLLLTAWWDNNQVVEVLGVGVAVKSLTRDVVFLSLAILSYRTTPKKIHKENDFNLAPPRELAILFFGIFMTLMPVIDILSGSGGRALADNLMQSSGADNPSAYFWLTGFFSSTLDNAPTYLVFFQLAGGQAEELMLNKSVVLMAISLGAVFMGANSYIGNAPNFMVKTLANQYKISAPHFFAYSFYSLVILLPIYFLIEYLFLK